MNKQTMNLIAFVIGCSFSAGVTYAQAKETKAKQKALDERVHGQIDMDVFKYLKMKQRKTEA